MERELYVVADGRGLSSRRRGILGPGDQVRLGDLGGDPKNEKTMKDARQALAFLVESGAVVAAPAPKAREESPVVATPAPAPKAREESPVVAEARAPKAKQRGGAQKKAD